MTASLLCLKGPTQGQRYTLDKDKTVLGRTPDCGVVIPGTAVSRYHAYIFRVQGKFFIEDNKSRNGTFVNNQAISNRTLLKNNDRIKICDILLTFHEQTEVKPLPAEMRRPEPEPAEEPDPTSTVEAAISHASSNLLLEAQPAEKLKALLEISTTLGKTLELNSLLPKIVDILFQIFRAADRAFLIMTDEQSKKLIPTVIKTRRVQDETNARFSRHIVNQCLTSVQALLSDDASSDSRFSMSQSIADFRIRSVMCAPLWTSENKAFGVIQLDTQDRTKKFTQDDLKLLMGVCSQASIALENAKLHENMLLRERIKRDLELAREVQRSFLPLNLPEVPGYEFYAFYDSAYEVGGDYYDFVPLQGKRMAIMLGDVAGKGVPAALLMAKISADARYCMLTEPEPAVAVGKLNALLNQAGLTDRFVTLAAAVLDHEQHTVNLVNAGHPSPLIYRAASGELEEATPKDLAGLPIGVLDGYDYVSFQVKLEPGDCVFTFSDGVTEAMDVNNKQFGMTGIREAVKGIHSPRALGEGLVNAVKQFATGRSQHDDITLVCFGRAK